MSNSSIIRPDPVFQQEGLWIFIHRDKKFISKSMMEIYYLIVNYLWNRGPINSVTEIRPPECLKPIETTNYVVDSGTSQKAWFQSLPLQFTRRVSVGEQFRPHNLPALSNGGDNNTFYIGMWVKWDTIYNMPQQYLNTKYLINVVYYCLLPSVFKFLTL